MKLAGFGALALTLSLLAFPVAGVHAQDAPPPGGPPPGAGGPPQLDLKAVALTAELFTAIRVNDRPAAVAALEKGADPNRPNWLEMTPLDWAAMLGRREIADLLIERGAKRDVGMYGTPITGALLLGTEDHALSLLEQGAGTVTRRPDKASTLMIAAAFGAPRLIDRLKPGAAQLDERDVDGATALIYAARRGQLATARRLLALGAKPDSVDSHGRTALMYAAMNGHRTVVEALLAQGANAALADTEKATALHLTARYCGDATIGRMLLKAKAPVSARDASGKTPLALATARRFSEMGKALTAAGAKPESMAAAPALQPSIQKSLGALQTGMKRFLAQSECSSCHHQGVGLAVLNRARLKGFAIDQGILDSNAQRIDGELKKMTPLVQLSQQNPMFANVVPTSEMEEIGIAGAYFMWALDESAGKPSPEMAVFAQYLAKQQQPEGNWRFTIHRGPMQESFQTATALHLLGIRRYLPANEAAPRLEKARQWLRSTATATNEDRASRLLGLRWSGLEPRELTAEIRDLLVQQRPDGGWGIKPGAPSDAMTTGLALYGLRAGGALAADSPAVRKAVSYLLRTQDENGTWYVNKTVAPLNYFFDAGFPGGESQYVSFAATGWATLALMEVAERPKTARR